MHHAISNYYQNAQGDWVAELDCGHDIALPHAPPAHNNAWVLTKDGRNDKLGVILLCDKCIAGAPRDREFHQFVASQY